MFNEDVFNEEVFNEARCSMRKCSIRLAKGGWTRRHDSQEDRCYDQ